jgi:hypothetical protein
MRNMALLFYYGAPLLLFKLSSHFAGEAGAGLSGLMNTSSTVADESAKAGTTVAKTGASLLMRR